MSSKGRRHGFRGHQVFYKVPLAHSTKKSSRSSAYLWAASIANAFSSLVSSPILNLPASRFKSFVLLRLPTFTIQHLSVSSQHLHSAPSPASQLQHGVLVRRDR